MCGRFCFLLGLMVLVVLLVSCGGDAKSAPVQLAFEAPMNVNSDQQFHVSLGVRNTGEVRFREYPSFNGAMQLRNASGEELARIQVATLWELAPGNAGWPAAYASRLLTGAYQLTWGAPDYGSVTVDFTLVELEGWLYLGEESIQSTSGDAREDTREHGALQSLVDLARVNLAQRLGVEAEAITVQGLEEVEFPDASLGVPEPDRFYAQVVTPGHVIKLAVDGQTYEYHASHERLAFAPQKEGAPQGSITIEDVQVTSGEQILFSYNHDGATELWTVDPASGETQRQIQPEQTVQDPSLSPSGETIAYVRVTGDYGGVVSELWLMGRDGSNPRLLYVPPASQSVLSSPAWSPDGHEMYFLQLGSGTDSQLLRMPVTGGEPATVLADCIDFALSLDGQWLASISLGRQVTISGRDGSGLRDLVPQDTAFTDYYSLAAAPEGNQLAFRAVEAAGEDTWNLYVMDWEGHNVRRLTDLSGFHPSTTSTGQVNGLAWTADGTHLVYSVDGHPKQAGIWVVGVEGGEPRRLFAWEEGEWAAVQGPWAEPAPSFPTLTVDESPIVSAEVDGPGHFEYTDRLGERILARIEGLRTYAAEQKLSDTNAALAPFGYRLEAHFDAEWNRAFHDLLREGETEPVLAGLSDFWPVSVNNSGTDFVMLAENAPNVLPLYLQIQADGVNPWDADQYAFLPPAYVDDALTHVTFTGFPTITYQVELDGQDVYSGTAEAMGAYMPLRSFITWDGHWALEVDDHLIMDGQDLGQSLGYDAAFGFHLIHGQPFYFFQQDGKVHISYDGKTLPNIYDQVLHNQCCEAAMHNVQSLGDTVLFHALWNGTWYFVEAGVYDGEMAGTYRYTAPEGWSFRHPMHWDRLDEDLGFVQDTATGKTVTFASQPTTQTELERWLESEIDRKLAATEAGNTLAEALTTVQEGTLTVYRYAILSRMDGSETLLRTTVFFDGQHRYEFYAAIPPLSEDEYQAITGSFVPVR